MNSLVKQKKKSNRSTGPGACQPSSDIDATPRGSKYPIFELSGSKNHTLNGVLDQILEY